MEMGGNFCKILELWGLLLRDGEYYKFFKYFGILHEGSL